MFCLSGGTDLQIAQSAKGIEMKKKVVVIGVRGNDIGHNLCIYLAPALVYDADVELTIADRYMELIGAADIVVLGDALNDIYLSNVAQIMKTGAILVSFYGVKPDGDGKRVHMVRVDGGIVTGFFGRTKEAIKIGVDRRNPIKGRNAKKIIEKIAAVAKSGCEEFKWYHF